MPSDVETLRQAVITAVAVLIPMPEDEVTDQTPLPLEEGMDEIVEYTEIFHPKKIILPCPIVATTVKELIRELEARAAFEDKPEDTIPSSR